MGVQAGLNAYGRFLSSKTAPLKIIRYPVTGELLQHLHQSRCNLWRQWETPKLRENLYDNQKGKHKEIIGKEILRKQKDRSQEECNEEIIELFLKKVFFKEELRP